MKIALIIRGKVRGPENRDAAEYLQENVDSLYNCLKPNENEVVKHLCSWNDEHSARIIEKKMFDSYLFLKEPPVEELKKIIKCTTNYAPGNENYAGAYGLFVNTRIILQQLCTDFSNYDYFVLGRPDIRIKINLDEWISDDYLMPNLRRNGPYSLNDQFFVAKPEVALAAWNFINIDTFNQIVTETADGGFEGVLGNIMKRNGVRTGFRNCTEYVFKWPFPDGRWP
jgi:hypothetical protein